MNYKPYNFRTPDRGYAKAEKKSIFDIKHIDAVTDPKILDGKILKIIVCDNRDVSVILGYEASTDKVYILKCEEKGEEK